MYKVEGRGLEEVLGGGGCVCGGRWKTVWFLFFMCVDLRCVYVVELYVVMWQWLVMCCVHEGR